MSPLTFDISPLLSFVGFERTSFLTFLLCLFSGWTRTSFPLIEYPTLISFGFWLAFWGS